MVTPLDSSSSLPQNVTLFKTGEGFIIEVPDSDQELDKDLLQGKENLLKNKIDEVWAKNDEIFKKCSIISLKLTNGSYEIIDTDLDTDSDVVRMHPKVVPPSIKVPSNVSDSTTASTATTSPLTDTPSPMDESVSPKTPEPLIDQSNLEAWDLFSKRQDERLKKHAEFAMGNSQRSSVISDGSERPPTPPLPHGTRSSVSEMSSSADSKVSQFPKVKEETGPKIEEPKSKLDEAPDYGDAAEKVYSKPGMQLYAPWAGVYNRDKTIENSTNLKVVGKTVAKVLQFTTTAFLVDLPISIGGIFAYGPMSYAAMTSEADPKDDESIKALKDSIRTKISSTIREMYPSIPTANIREVTQAVLQSDQFKSLARRLALRCSFYALRAPGKKLLYFFPALGLAVTPGALRETINDPGKHPKRMKIIKGQTADPILELNDSLSATGVKNKFPKQLKGIVSEVVNSHPEWDAEKWSQKDKERAQKLKRRDK